MPHDTVLKGAHFALQQAGLCTILSPMRKLLIVTSLLLAAHVALLFVRRSASAGTSADADVGIVFDVGGRGDKSFNDGAYVGADARRPRARRQRALHRARRRRRTARPGCACSPPRGWTSSSASASSSPTTSTQLAKEYPGRHASPASTTPWPPTRTATPIPPPPNLAALKFREEEGSFLVGALAALVGKNTKKVGFVGGMDIPLIHKFEAGYRAGVKQVCPDCEVIAQYAGVTPEAFRNPGKGKELALSQYQQGVNVIFHASGSTGPACSRRRAPTRQAGDRRRRRPVRRGAGLRAHVDGEGRRRRRCSTRSSA